MKSIVPWFCLAAVTNMAFADDGIDAYRLGNYDTAAKILLNSKNKDPIADFYIAKMRLYGYGAIKNNDIAIRHYELAAERGLLSAQKIMARYELLETANLEKALYWFKKAAATDDTSALMYCASAYYFGVGVKVNRDRAKKYYIAAAKNGDSIAQYSVARNFLKTRHKSNKKLGMIWLSKSLKQHNPAAQLLMADQYISGEMVDKDLAKARELINLSISQNYIPAYYKLGELDLKEKKYEDARQSFLKASNGKYIPATIALSDLYAMEDSPFYNPHESFLWMLKAAQLGSKKAIKSIAKSYKDGIGTDADDSLAEVWHKKYKERSKSSDNSATIAAVRWLTDRKAINFADTRYDLRGILSSWHNSLFTKQNNYNKSPQLENITRSSLYNPVFKLVDPDDVPISDYYDMLVSDNKNLADDKWDHPLYLIAKSENISEKDRAERHRQQDSLGFDYLLHALMTSDSKIDYKSLFDKLLAQADIGDTAAQFDIGQMYQSGLGVERNIDAAIKYYKLAAAQENLPSEYNLGLIYLTGDGVEPDYKLALHWLNDAAFKGNDYSEYVLARIYESGYKDKNGKEVIAADHDRAVDMYRIASANNFGLAQYRLAEIMVRDKPVDISERGLQHRNKLIKGLYEKSLANNITDARLPLAFYYSMEEDTKRQQWAFEAANKEATKGNQQAALLLGLMYDRGIVVTENKDASMRWYQQSGDNPVSSFIMGTYTASGKGVNKDTIKAQELLQKAVNSNFSYANLNMAIIKKENGGAFLPYLSESLAEGNNLAGLLLADYYLSNSADDKQLKEAHSIFKQFAEKGDKEAQLKLAFLYEKGIGGKIDYKEAEKWYTTAAEQGQPKAQYLLARLYQLGKTDKVPRYDLAKKWYNAARDKYPQAAVALGFIYDTEDENYHFAMSQYKYAADKGDIIGAYNLALLYERGEGCGIDYKKSQELYFMAAKQGHKESMYQLGGIYLNGFVGSPDVREAFKWYKKSAELGDRDALYQLGLMYETGVATKLDYAKAKVAYKKAAELGNEKANMAIARIYQHGIGGSKDVLKSAAIYKSLSERGNSYAQYQMAVLCFKGVPENCSQDQGLRWLKEAQKYGDANAETLIDWVGAKNSVKLSFIQPAQFSAQVKVPDSTPSDLLYLNALNAWNVGEERYSKQLLSGLLSRHPNNFLAKETYKQLISINSLKSIINLSLND
ncbi:MAG: tetratricopeptide repeat protein [Legionellaceae bacterium]|nr:tetratricopeptide repeat protein [Legionellaceae bacterium]